MVLFCTNQQSLHAVQSCLIYNSSLQTNAYLPIAQVVMM